MTPDLFSIAIMLDTSALHGVGASSAPFQVLQGLAKAGLVRVYVPQLGLEEFRTQWRDRTHGNAIQAEKSLKALSGEQLLPASVVAGASSLASELALLELEEKSKEFAKAYMDESGFETLPLTFDQCAAAWDDYFIGKLPSKKAKHRPDIPDAHILAALRELSSSEESVLFVTSDKGQREAAAAIQDVDCFENFEGLIKSLKLQPFVAKWQAEQQWQAVRGSLSFDEISQQVWGFVQTQAGELLPWEEVIDPSIPEDNHTASIAMYGEPDEIELTGPEDWGGGLLRYQAKFFSECLLNFQVFRGEAFDVPEWVSVSIGDFDKDHYFDAEGYAVLLARVDVTVKVNVEDGPAGHAGSVQGISFEDGSLELELAPND